LPSNVNHHVGLRVTDIERSARFYLDAFPDAKYKALPFTIEGDFAEVVFDGPPGVSFQCCMIDFGEGTIELFEFNEPAHPSEPVHATRGNLLHFGIQVDDVADALERVEAAGGTRLWPGVNPWGTAKVVYVLDPDGNVLELIDASMDEIAALTFENFPDANPANQEARA
jgi:catechol 2,3-dioxygenase-like lactoylglutathione lyase family enzyme